MTKFTELQLTNFTKPVSDTEEQKLENAKKAIKEAIDKDLKLSQKIEIFGQGSYANDTNVKNNSDIDINIMYKEGFYYKIPPNTKKEDFGIVNTSSYSFKEFKNDVEQALLNNFKGCNVNRKNKCISINIYGIDVDVVPTCVHRIFSLNGNLVEGVTLFTDNTNQQIINYPKQHIENGKNKNSHTHKRFKWLTRIYKRIRYEMIDDRIPINNNITSFLLECLVWNVPNDIFNNYSTWTDRLRESIIYLYRETKDGGSEKCKKWVEVSERLYLFHKDRKWSIRDVNNYLLQLWYFLKY